MTKVMLRVQVNNENGNPRDQGPPPSGTSAQAQSYHSQHPSNKLLHLPPPPQDMKRTNLIHETAVGQLFQSDMSVKEALKAVHTMSVSESIAKLEPNLSSRTSLQTLTSQNPPFPGKSDQAWPDSGQVTATPSSPTSTGWTSPPPTSARTAPPRPHHVSSLQLSSPPNQPLPKRSLG